MTPDDDRRPGLVQSWGTLLVGVAILFLAGVGLTAGGLAVWRWLLGGG